MQNLDEVPTFLMNWWWEGLPKPACQPTPVDVTRGGEGGGGVGAWMDG